MTIIMMVTTTTMMIEETIVKNDDIKPLRQCFAQYASRISFFFIRCCVTG